MPQVTPFDQFSHATNKGWFATMIFLLRIAFGFLFVYSAWSKLSGVDWSAQNYLLASTGPLAFWFQSLAGNPLVDFLNVYGQLAIGFAILLGLLVRPASLFGAMLMALYYLSHFTENIAHGFIDDHIVYALVFLMMCAGGFGYVWGLDGLIARQPSLQRKKWVRWLFG